mmetsp:Transcript_81948/g.171484  ORF Transcript_81948/g.171484 Transcript_81948/m.171484 type:complete len:304 (-) Transcript_81948:46-957(-)
MLHRPLKPVISRQIRKPILAATSTRCFSDWRRNLTDKFNQFMSMTPDGFATKYGYTPPGAALAQLLAKLFQKVGGSMIPPHNTICNCGADLGLNLPRVDLVTKIPEIKHLSREWRMQVYGASLYYHLATTSGERRVGNAPDMITGKDVLEIGCTRGGGARYLAEVLEPKRYVAIDSDEKMIEECKAIHKEAPANLEFQVADVMKLQDTFPAESFDFVVCVQTLSLLPNVREFLVEVARVLRPGGRLLLADAFNRRELRTLLDAADELEFFLDAQADLSAAVYAVGICQVPSGVSYYRIVARKI